MKRDENGIALVITLFLMATLSALAVSMMFLAQTETASSRNYRTMSQARYAAEAGVHAMVNYLMNPPPPGYGALSPSLYQPPSSPYTGYGLSYSPVTCTSGCTHMAPAACDGSTIAKAVTSGCIVIGYSAATSNNPGSTFYSSASGTLAVNSSGSTSNGAAGTVTYGAAAILISMKSVIPYGSSTASLVQTWQIISDGTVPPSTAAIVEVSTTLEREWGTAQTFAVFATGTGCGAISLQGNVSTASTNDGSTVQTSGGNVGTDGNMTIGGHVDVHGALSSPRAGVGTCTSGQTMTALTESGSANVDNNDIVQLPQALNFPTPSAPSPVPPVTAQSASAATCITVVALNVSNPGTTCTYSGGTATVTPGSPNIPVVLGNISGNWALQAGNYNINSIGSGDLSLPGAGRVSVNLAGKNSDGSWMTNPFNLNGQAVVNTSLDASKFEVLYAGPGSFDLTGGSQSAMLLYAPNATVTTHGNADIWGSLLVAGITSAGTPRFIYDNRLQKEIVTLGNFMLTSFSWKKY